AVRRRSPLRRCLAICTRLLSHPSTGASRYFPEQRGLRSPSQPGTLSNCPSFLLCERNAALGFGTHPSPFASHATASAASSKTVVTGENLSRALQACNFCVDQCQHIGLVHEYPFGSEIRKRQAVAT